MSKIVVATLIGMMFFATLVESTPVAKNTREFRILCRLLKIAEEGALKLNPETEAARLMDWEHIVTVEGDITSMKKTLTELATFPFNLTDAVTGENYTISAEKKDSVLKSLEAAAPMALAIIRNLTRQKRAVQEELETARGKFMAAIVGEEKEDFNGEKYKTTFTFRGLDASGRATKAAASVNRKAICKANGNGAEGGYTLRTDLMCICAVGETGGTYTKYMCGFDTSGGSNYWTGQTQTGLDTIWGKIYAACEKRSETEKITSQSIDAALTAFESLLGAGASGVTNVRAKVANTFGYIATGEDGTIECTASGDVATGDNGVCVIYGETGANITWRLRMLEAKTYLESAREKALLSQRMVRRLDHLHTGILNVIFQSPSTNTHPNQGVAEGTALKTKGNASDLHEKRAGEQAESVNSHTFFEKPCMLVLLVGIII